MQGRKRTKTSGKVESQGLGDSGWIYANQVNLCDPDGFGRPNCPEAQRQPRTPQLQESHEFSCFGLKNIPGFLVSIFMRFLGRRTLFSVMLISFKLC